jgi:hypothetical protein
MVCLNFEVAGGGSALAGLTSAAIYQLEDFLF